MSAVIQSQCPGAGRLPLAVGDPDRLLVFGGGAPVTLRSLLDQARRLAGTLPEARHVVHLAEDRHRFLLGFCAGALCGQVALLPPSGAPGSVAEILAQPMAGGAYRLDPVDPAAVPVAGDAPAEPLLDPAATAAIAYTSGSTGRPRGHAKTWAALAAGTALNLVALSRLWGGAQPQIVATVPSQHMYGLELTVLLPLLGGAAVHAGRPLLPADVARALEQASAPRVLVTTPVHLRALLRSGVSLPPLAGIVSATAPLARELAADAEARYGTELCEMFGSTETGVIAHRRTACDESWSLLPGVRLAAQPDGTQVHVAHLPAPVVLADLIEAEPEGRFHLRGRQADLLEIAGKRASLGDLTRRLLAVPGVVDGVVLQLEPHRPGGVGRIGALAVAPGVSASAIVEALRGTVDPVFLPRRLRLLAQLPRNETGKLRRDTLLALLQDGAGANGSSAVPEGATDAA